MGDSGDEDNSSRDPTEEEVLAPAEKRMLVPER
jgi:hypothetical protein